MIVKMSVLSRANLLLIALLFGAGFGCRQTTPAEISDEIWTLKVAMVPDQQGAGHDLAWFVVRNSSDHARLACVQPSWFVAQGDTSQVSMKPGPLPRPGSCEELDEFRLVLPGHSLIAPVDFSRAQLGSDTVQVGLLFYEKQWPAVGEANYRELSWQGNRQAALENSAHLLKP